jgi:hypothetical protein
VGSKTRLDVMPKRKKIVFLPVIKPQSCSLQGVTVLTELPQCVKLSCTLARKNCVSFKLNEICT